jgi:hypothetical protein
MLQQSYVQTDIGVLHLYFQADNQRRALQFQLR